MMLAKTVVGELSARPTPGDIVGVFSIHPYTPTVPRGMLVASSMLTSLDRPSHQ